MLLSHINQATEIIVWNGMTANQIIAIISIMTTFVASLGAIIVNILSINKNKELSVENRYLNVITNNHMNRIKDMSSLVAQYCALVLRNASCTDHCIDDDTKVFILSTQITLYCNRLSRVDEVIKKALSESNNYYVKALSQQLSDDAEKGKFIDSVDLVEKLLLIYIKVEYEEAAFEASNGLKSKFPFEEKFIAYINSEGTINEIQHLENSVGIDILSNLNS